MKNVIRKAFKSGLTIVLTAMLALPAMAQEDALKGYPGYVDFGTLGEIFGEMRIVDSRSRSASAYAVGETICLAVNTQAGERLKGDGGREDALELLVLLYRIFAEYMSIRLRLTNEELITAKKKIKRLITKI